MRGQVFLSWDGNVFSKSFTNVKIGYCHIANDRKRRRKEQSHHPEQRFEDKYSKKPSSWRSDPYCLEVTAYPDPTKRNRRPKCAQVSG